MYYQGIDFLLLIYYFCTIFTIFYDNVDLKQFPETIDCFIYPGCRYRSFYFFQWSRYTVRVNIEILHVAIK